MALLSRAMSNCAECARPEKISVVNKLNICYIRDLLVLCNYYTDTSELFNMQM